MFILFRPPSLLACLPVCLAFSPRDETVGWGIRSRLAYLSLFFLRPSFPVMCSGKGTTSCPRRVKPEPHRGRRRPARYFASRLPVTYLSLRRSRYDHRRRSKFRVINAAVRERLERSRNLLPLLEAAPLSSTTPLADFRTFLFRLHSLVELA